jgi:N-acyl homoserine lactone hydrolase
LMLGGKVDGVSGSDEAAKRTLAAIRSFASDHPTVYLPTHDADSATRLASRAMVVSGED